MHLHCGLPCFARCSNHFWDVLRGVLTIFACQYFPYAFGGGFTWSFTMFYAVFIMIFGGVLLCFAWWLDVVMWSYGFDCFLKSFAVLYWFLFKGLFGHLRVPPM